MSSTGVGAHASGFPDHGVVPPVWSRITNIEVDRGEGSWLITPTGERYLDYSSGIGVTNTGHAHPRVVAAIQAQAAKLLHGQQNIVYHEPGLRLYERLAGLLPGGPWGAFLSNSGAEAVEAAVKLARVATGRPVIISFRGGFHGRTGQTMALTTAKDVYRAAFEPLPGSVYHTKFPYCYQAAGGPHTPDATAPATGRPSSTAVPSGHLPESRRGHHRRARPGRRRLHRPAAGVPAATPRDHPAARHPAHRGRGPDGLRADRRDVRRPALGGRAGHPRDGQGHRVGDAAVRDHRPAGGPGGIRPGHPRRHVRRQRRLMCRGPGDARRHRGRGPHRQCPRARCAVRRWAAGAPGGPSGHRRRPGPRCMVAMELVKPGVGDGRGPTPISPSG